MRIVSWNMARGPRPAGLDADPWQVLATLDADVALLQECKQPVDGTIRGHLHFAPSKSGWGTAVWSRHPLGDRVALPPSDDERRSLFAHELDGYVATATVNVPGAPPLLAVSVHAWPAPLKLEVVARLGIDGLKTPAAKKVWPTDLIWLATRHLPSASARVVLGGDWNAARLFDTVYGPRGNQEFFDRMAETGWHEVMRRFHKNEHQTYFRKGRGPYQLDHVFVSSALLSGLASARVETEGGVRSASDHAPVVVEWSAPK